MNGSVENRAKLFMDYGEDDRNPNIRALCLSPGSRLPKINEQQRQTLLNVTVEKPEIDSKQMTASQSDKSEKQTQIHAKTSFSFRKSKQGKVESSECETRSRFGGTELTGSALTEPIMNDGCAKYDRRCKKYSLPARMDEFSVQGRKLTKCTLDYDLQKMRKKSCITFKTPVSKQSENLVKAIEFAAHDVNKKELKKHKRNSCSGVYNEGLGLTKSEKDGKARPTSLKKPHSPTCNFQDCLHNRLEECKNSESMLSNVDRQYGRRLGIAEKSELERRLVKTSVKYLMKNEYDDF